MKKEEKKLAFLKNSAAFEKKENFYANYFRDLEIIAVSSRILSPGVIRHKSFSCPENAASLEYIRRGKVFLHLDKAKILLRGPCIFWITGEFERYRFEYVEDSPEYEHIWADFRGERALRIRKALFHLSDLCYREIPEANNSFEPLFQELLFSFRNDREKEHNHMVIVLERLLEELYLLAEEQRESPWDPYGIEALADSSGRTLSIITILPGMPGKEGFLSCISGHFSRSLRDCLRGRFWQEKRSGMPAGNWNREE